ncbi:MAG: DUF481 domain-containing protein [Acidobacteria bacterium]|nr:DUF481 domain-containing protein [Acidobacteriota bacterium]
MRRREVLRRRGRRPRPIGATGRHLEVPELRGSGVGRATTADWVRRAALLAMVLWPAQLAAQTPGADTDDDDNPGWDNATELSVVRTGGNAETQTLGFSNTLRVRGAAHRLRLRFDGVRSRTGDERYLTLPPGVRFPLGGTPENFETVVVRPPLDPDVEQYFLEGRYDRELGERFLWHAGASWDRNRDAGIRNRNMIFAGVGNTWADRESLALSTAYGFSYTTREEEETDGFKANRFAGLRINGDYRQQLGTITTLDGALTMNVNMTDRSDYSLNTASGASVAMTDHLSLRVSLQWLYEHQPALEEAAIVARIALRDPDGIPSSGDELFETVVNGGLTVDLGTGRLRKDGLDTILRTALVISF